MRKQAVPRTLIEDTLVPHQPFLSALSRLEQCFAYASSTREPICIALVGESRTGKSRALEEFAVEHPITRSDEGLSIPILRVTTPSKPTVKGLVELMLEGMHDELAARGTENQKTSRLIKLMKECGTRMVMIDEFHHFVDKGSSKVIYHAADWLKTLVDKLRCVLVVAGLPYCKDVLAQNEQFQGRFYAPLHMPRFDWKIAENREEFIAILGAFHESMSRHFDLPELHSTEMAFRCYCGSGGLVGYLAKFLRQVVWNAIDEGKRVITLDKLAVAQDQAVWVEEGSTGLPNPFTDAFRPVPNEELLLRIHSIGKPADPPLKPRTRPSRSKGLKIQDVMSAT